MLCERCKIREANIKYMEVINGVKTEHNLCSQCAREMDFGPYSAIFDGEFPLAKLLSGLLGVEEDNKQEEDHQQIVCPTCGTTYDEFVKNSCFGCADCYGVFDLLINDSIRQLQGSAAHVGKKPSGQSMKIGEELRESQASDIDSVEDQIKTWDARLKEALREEEYELAAEYRDKIRELKGGKQIDG